MAGGSPATIPLNVFEYSDEEKLSLIIAFSGSKRVSVVRELYVQQDNHIAFFSERNFFAPCWHLQEFQGYRSSESGKSICPAFHCRNLRLPPVIGVSNAMQAFAQTVDSLARTAHITFWLFPGCQNSSNSSPQLASHLTQPHYEPLRLPHALRPTLGFK